MSDVLHNEEYGLGVLPPVKIPTAQDMLVKAVNNEIEDSFADTNNAASYAAIDLDDEYGGFGSLSEMAKNKDKLADKVMNSPPKGDSLVAAKLRMK